MEPLIVPNFSVVLYGHLDISGFAGIKYSFNGKAVARRNTTYSIILESSVDRLLNMMIPFKTAAYRLLAIHPLSECGYPPIALFLWFICLTTKALRRISI